MTLNKRKYPTIKWIIYHYYNRKKGVKNFHTMNTFTFFPKVEIRDLFPETLNLKCNKCIHVCFECFVATHFGKNYTLWKSFSKCVNFRNKSTHYSHFDKHFKVRYEVTSTFFSIEILNTLWKICIKHKCRNLIFNLLIHVV